MMHESTNSQLSPDEAENELFSQAMELCRLVHENPADKLLLDQAQQWQAQSEKHQQCWQQTQVYWQASGEIKVQFNEKNLLNRFILAWQVKADKTLDTLANLKASTVYKPGVGLVLSCCLLFALFLVIPSKQAPVKATAVTPKQARNTTTHYQSGWRQQREISLDDQSIIKLNWDSKVTVTMSQQQRRVTLHRGEAEFIVTTDKSRPFIVETQGVEAKAVGTAFIVRRDHNNQARITVTEGIVEVKSTNTNAIQLVLNQQVSSTEEQMGDIISVNASDVIAWQQGLLIFDQQPLAEVLAELNRYTSFNIEVGLISQPEQPVTGTYFTQRADDALGLIALAFSLELEQKPSSNSVRVKSSI